MSQPNSILKDIKNKKFAPIYFLSGEEPFFIDQVSKAIESDVLTEDEKGFNQTILYGNDVEMADVLALAKQFPMGAERQVVIVKEAQHLSRSIDQLESYAENPQPSTVLVFNYKGKSLDKRKKLYKTLQKNSVVLETKRIYDNQIPDWIETTAKEMGMNLEAKSKFMMAESLGSDLGRIYNELQKLKILAETGNITPEIIQKNIGISKDYNNFELRNAIETRNAVKAFKIANYFSQNPKDNPLVVTLSILYQTFSNIIVYHTLSDKSQSNVAKELGLHPFFVKDAATAAKNYPLKKATRIISLLRETDVKSKGVGSTGNVSDGDLLNELLFKIFNI
ncbi:MAG: DNA polymerase III subunit delta [Flavobacteriaceae bacterium]|jgi:DNA polymerase-3 subunit delta|nr:DNA polymerase III subunit delta [Flavobacteriaceae bacterium]